MLALKLPWSRFGLLLLLGMIFCPKAADAHDYWLAADGSTDLMPGQDAVIRLWVGDDVTQPEEELYRQAKMWRFVHVAREGTTDLRKSAVDGAAPIVTLPELSPGGHLVAMDRSYSNITLPGWKFKTYLFVEGFAAASEARSAAGKSWAEGKERYSRYLKTFFAVGEARASDSASKSVFGRVLGQRYELVPKTDPSRLKPGQSLTMQVLLERSPAAGVRVVAKSTKGEEIEGETDSHGLVQLTLPVAGDWVIRSVHMRPCSDCKRADWESLWAAYSFRME